MPSHLRLQSSFEEPIEAHAIHQTSPTLPPRKKQRMSLTQTYYVASTARSKLGREAGRADHNLRRLVGHANLLDGLMLELQDAEREQEAWFNQSLRTASKPEEPKHIQWLDELPEDDEESSDEEDSDDEGIEGYTTVAPLRRTRSPPTSYAYDDFVDEDEDNQELSLARVPSNKHSPPELTMDDDEDSSDEDECPSPDMDVVEFELSEKEQQQVATTTLYDLKSQMGMGDYITARPIAAC